MKKLGKKEILLIIVFVISIIFFNIREFSFKMNEKLVIEEALNEEGNAVENEEIDTSKEASTEEKEPREIKVDISGAVKNPGVISLKEGDRLIDVINKAGGLTDKADINRINRSKYVHDSEKIIIYEIGQEIDYSIINNSESLGVDNKVNINTASKEELITLNGIGESIGENIIKYRKENNGFKSIEDIMKVSGIGKSKFNQIKDSIKVK